MEDNITHKETTDEEIYQMLAENKSVVFMDAEKWKELRLKELKRIGKRWSI